MAGYLLSISFILHLITFFSIVLLAKKMRTALDYEKLELQKREIEDLLAFYAVQLKEDNTRLLEKVMQPSGNAPEDDGYRDEQAKQKIQEQANEKTAEKRTDAELKADADTYELSLEAQALQLHGQGYSPEEIAKKLNKGHGEIELLLKFYESK